MTAGTGRNVVPAQAHLVIESRGATTELDAYVYDYAVRILEAAAEMHDCTVEIEAMGGAQSADSDPELAARVEEIAHAVGDLTIRDPETGGGSEDFTYMMRRVQERGGLATNVGVGAGIGAGGHHTAEFDIDERAIPTAVKLLSAVTLDLMDNPTSPPSPAHP